jgi:hypothetical protein
MDRAMSLIDRPGEVRDPLWVRLTTSLVTVGHACWVLGCGSDGARIIQPEPESNMGVLDVAGMAGSPSEVDPPSTLSTADDGTETEVAVAESVFVAVPGGDFQSGGAPPAEGASVPNEILELTAPTGVTNGGTAILRVTLAQPNESPLFIVSVEGDDGYHSVVGSDVDGDGVYEIEVQVRGDVQAPSLLISVAPTDGMGNVGEYRQVTLELVQSGVGDVKVTLSFDPAHDLDLHVIEPGGEEISFAHPMSARGGALDLDSGSNCIASAASSENIFWPAGSAPRGDYRVRVNLFEQCLPGAIPFTVRVENGEKVDTYRGSFADGTQGTFSEVVTFRH